MSIVAMAAGVAVGAIALPLLRVVRHHFRVRDLRKQAGAAPRPRLSRAARRRLAKETSKSVLQMERFL